MSTHDDELERLIRDVEDAPLVWYDRSPRGGYRWNARATVRMKGGPIPEGLRRILVELAAAATRRNGRRTFVPPAARASKGVERMTSPETGPSPRNVKRALGCVGLIAAPFVVALLFALGVAICR